MKKVILIFLFIFLTFPKLVLAEDNFTTETNITYQVLLNGDTKVTHDILLTNKTSETYISEYKLLLQGVYPASLEAIDNDGNKIDISVKENNDTKEINIKFKDAVVGIDKSRQFQIKYIDQSLAIKSGEVWEISIPRIDSSVDLIIPKILGEAAFISPDPKEIVYEENRNIYKFNKNELTQSGVVAAFGKFQVFSFSITYHLENPINKESSFKITIPPDTAFQKIIYKTFDPKPQNVEVDSDGNWIANFILNANERRDVILQGFAQIYAGPVSFIKPSNTSLQENLNETKYWQTKDVEIQRLASVYNTPRKIYDYVVETLSYNYDRVRPNVIRLGAADILKNPDNAICMEFTDAFIAISRAAGIPAREINGYAYTENNTLQPLSLVADVLHSWPEYWNYEKEVWTPVDPTWGNTSGGIDYFNKFDLRHIAFVIHGKSDTEPYSPGSYKLGASPQKDVFISFAQLPEARNSKPSLELDTNNLRVINNGPSALYNQEVKIFFDNILIDTKTIEALPPYAYSDIDISMSSGIFGRKLPNKISAEIGEISVSTSTHKATVIISNLTGSLFIIIILVLLTLLKTGKLKIK